MKRVVFILVFLLCFSCRCNEDTYYLKDGEVALFPYESESSVSFIDGNQDVIVFDNIFYERDIYEESSPPVLISFGPKCDDSYEEIFVHMSSGSDYELYLGTSSGFETTIVDNALGYFQLEEYEYINNYTFDGIIYNDVLRVYSNYHESVVILIPSIGVVSIQYGYSGFTPELLQSFTLLN